MQVTGLMHGAPPPTITLTHTGGSNSRNSASMTSRRCGGALGERELATAAFNVFLYGRMIGAAAEIDDHLNRGRNMDTRAPEAQCAHVH